MKTWAKVGAYIRTIHSARKCTMYTISRPKFIHDELIRRGNIIALKVKAAERTKTQSDLQRRLTVRAVPPFFRAGGPQLRFADQRVNERSAESGQDVLSVFHHGSYV